MKHGHFIMPALVCLLTGCGAGGGGVDSGEGGGEVMPAVTGGTVGSRAVPDYAIQVGYLGSVQPGANLTVQATVTADDGQPSPSVIEASIGRDEPTVWTTGVPVAGQATVWNWSVTLPTELTGQRVWVRITDVEGNTVESGLDDFPLLP